jgi:hypothetical protein
MNPDKKLRQLIRDLQDSAFLIQVAYNGNDETAFATHSARIEWLAHSIAQYDKSGMEVNNADYEHGI